MAKKFFCAVGVICTAWGLVGSECEPAKEDLFGVVEKSPLFRRYEDPESKVVSYILKPGIESENQQSVYFVCESMTEDCRFLLFDASENEWHHKGKPQETLDREGRVIDFKTGRIYKCPYTDVPFMDTKADVVWFADVFDKCIKRIDLLKDPTKAEKVCSIPSEFVDRSLKFQRFSTHLTLTRDRRRAFMAFTVDEETYHVGMLELATGKWQPWFETMRYYNHDQLNPARDDLAMVAWECCFSQPEAVAFSQASGWYPRIWLVNEKGEQSLQQNRFGNYATHEHWNRDGKGFYWCSPCGVIRQDLATGDQECVSPRVAAHATMTADNRYVCHDGAEGPWYRGCNWRVTFWNRAANRGIYVHTLRPALCPITDQSRLHPDPHPHFAGRDRYIICTINNADGHMDLSVTPVAQLIRRTAAGDAACFGPDPAVAPNPGKTVWWQNLQWQKDRREVAFHAEIGDCPELLRIWPRLRNEANAALRGSDAEEDSFTLETAIVAAKALNRGADELAAWERKLASLPPRRNRYSKRAMVGIENYLALEEGANVLKPGSDGVTVRNVGGKLMPAAGGFLVRLDALQEGRIVEFEADRARLVSYFGKPFVIKGDWRMKEALSGKAVPAHRTKSGYAAFPTERHKAYLISKARDGSGVDSVARKE